jgi:hypothetical protein
MLTGSTFTGANKLRTSKGTLVLVGFVFVFLVTSLAIGLRTSNASLPVSLGRGCHGSGEGEDAMVTCSTSTTLTSTSTTDSTTTATSTVISTSSSSQDPVAPVAPANCNALNGISYQMLAAGTNVTIAFNGNGQMTYTVPSESFSWNWYWVPANGMSTSALGQEITTTMWSSGHGQDFSFFAAQFNRQAGIVLQTDYALSQACG